MTSDGAMTGDDIWRAVAAERASLVDLLETLSETDWNHSSLCEGWRIRDVVAHLVLSTRASVGWILLNLVRARGSITRLSRDTAIRHADHTTPEQLLAELRDTIGSRFTAIGTTPTDRLLDLLVHGQDIAVPLGMPREMPTTAARLAIDRVWTTGAPFHAGERLSGYRLAATDTAWTVGDGLAIDGPVAALLMLTTGRTATLTQLSGSGADALRSTQTKTKEPSMSRIVPVVAPCSDALQQRFDRVVPAGLKPPRLYRVVARNESLFLDLVDSGLLGRNGLFDRGVLPPRLREILILRTCVAAGNDYEWHLHVDSKLSTRMGLRDTEIADIRTNAPDTDFWTAAERVAMALADALVFRIDVDDVVYAVLREHYDESTLIEMTQLIGWYTVVAMQVAPARPVPDFHPPG